MESEPRPSICLVSEARKVAWRILWAEAVKGLLGGRNIWVGILWRVLRFREG